MGELVDIVRELRDTICNDIISSRDAVGIDFHKIVDHEATLYAVNGFTIGEFLGPL